MVTSHNKQTLKAEVSAGSVVMTHFFIISSKRICNSLPPSCTLFFCGVPNFSSHPQAGGCCEYTQERFQRQSEERGGGRSRPVCPQEPCFFSGSCFGQCSFPWLSPVLHTVVLLRRAVVCRKVSLSVVTCRHQHYLSIKSVNVSQFHHISYRGFNAYPKSH